MKREVRFLFIAAGILWLMKVWVEREPNQPDSPRSKRVVTGHIAHSEHFHIKHFYKSEGYAGKIIDPNGLTIVTHCSVDRLHYLLNLLEVWDGPVSVSILVLGDDAAFVDDVIDGIRQCWPVTRTSFSFHLVYSLHPTYKANFTGIGGFAYFSCKDVMRKMMTRKPKLVPGKSTIFYPHNMMRNAALRGATSEYVLVTDVELIPNENLRTSFLQFATDNKLFPPIVPGANMENDLLFINEEVFILPVFEYKKYEDIGHTKQDLIKAIESSKARRYMEVTCPYCHKPLDYSRWLAIETRDDKLATAYNVSFVPLWEPFYITRRRNAWYNTGFARPGHDRLIQMCEMTESNTKFSVLDNAFLLREGFLFKSSPGGGISARSDQIRLHQSFQEELRKIDMSEKIVQRC